MDKEKSPGWGVIEKAKSRKLTKPQTKEQSDFDNLYNFIENYGSSDNWLQFLTIDLCKSGLPEGEDIKILKPVMLKIMKSEIFYNGGLRGADNAGDELRYKSYQPKDCLKFIYELSRLLIRYETRVSGWSPEAQEYWFSEAVKRLKIFMGDVLQFKGKRPAQRFKTLLGDLQDLEKEVSAAPDITPKISKPTLKKNVTSIFRKHIQAPGTIIADRVAELLTLFEIETTPGSIRKILPKKQKSA